MEITEPDIENENTVLIVITLTVTENVEFQNISQHSALSNFFQKVTENRRFLILICSMISRSVERRDIIRNRPQEHEMIDIRTWQKDIKNAIKDRSEFY